MVDVPESLCPSGRTVGAEFPDFGVPVLLRRIETRDRPWLVDLFRRRYPSHWNVATADAWIAEVVLTNPIQFYATRNADAFQITSIATSPWTPQTYRADVVGLCCDHGKIWQLLPLLRDSIQWSYDCQCHEWRFANDTGFDLGPIMKRLNAGIITPRYQLNLRRGRNGG